MNPPPGFTPRPSVGGYHQLIGPFYIAGAPGELRRFGFCVDERHTNPGGRVHGGLLMTLMDMVLTTTVIETIGHSSLSTVSLNCDFVAPVQPGDWVGGIGEVTRLTSAFAFVRGRLAVGDTPVMAASGVWRIFAPPPREDRASAS